MDASAKSVLCCALLLLCMVTVNFQRAEAQPDTPGCGGFQASCTNFQLTSSGIWSSDCKTDSSGNTFASHAEMSTDQFLGNNDGSLVEGAGYVESCTGLAPFLQDSVAGVFIQATCTDASGNSHFATYNVDHNIVNINGALKWNFC